MRKAKDIVTKRRANLLRESIRDYHMIVVASLMPQNTCDIGRSGRSWLVFKTSQIGLNLVLVDFDLDLMREFDVNS